MPLRRRPRTPKERPLARQAAADASATLIFVFFMSLAGELSRSWAPKLELNPEGAGLAYVVVLLLCMLPVCRCLGGALFNPANNALLYATGKGTFWGHTVRVVGQCIGAVGGVALAKLLLPLPWQRELSSFAVGLRSDVDIFEGATCEFVLGMLLAFLVSLAGDLQSRFWRLWLPMVATVLAVRAGTPYSGPSLNPAVTYGWEFFYQQQSRAEHLFVFWVAPLASGFMGGLSYLGMKQFMAQRAPQKSKEE